MRAKAKWQAEVSVLMVEIAIEDARGDVMPDKHMAIVKVFLL
jgi:hypothetical protein